MPLQDPIPVDPLNVIDELNNLVEENDYQEICVICQDILDNGEEQIYRLPECDHGYHTNCIMTWFRSGNNKCPHCGNRGLNSNNLESKPGGRYRTSRFWYTCKKSDVRYKLLRNVYKRDDCPKELKTYFSRYDNLVKELSDLNKIKKEGAAARDELPYKEAQKVINKMRNDQFNTKRKMNTAFDNILKYPIIPLIIPQKKTIR